MSDSDHASQELRELIGEPEIPLVASPLAGFAPWHLPRKQYVRARQWMPEIQKLVRDLKLEETDFVYLSLPGDDLLDVHLLRSTVCEPNNLNLKFLGFNTAAHPSNPQQQRLDINLHGVKRLPNVDQISHVYPDDLRLIARPTSVQRRRVTEFGPFHALNIDLCDGFARPPSPDSKENLFDALEVVLQNQSRTKHDSLIFITTRFDDQEVDLANRELLEQLLHDNLENCGPFHDALASEWNMDPDVDADAALDALTRGEKFILGFAKWIIAASARYRLGAAVNSVLTYRVHKEAGDDDLLSVSIRLSPDTTVRADPRGLAMSTYVGDDSAECTMSAPLPARVSHRRSVDDILGQDEKEYQQMLDESAALLVSAGYDEDQYRAWAQDRISR